MSELVLERDTVCMDLHAPLAHKDIMEITSGLYSCGL